MSGPKISEAQLRKIRLDNLIKEENVKLDALRKKIRMLNNTICEFLKKKDEVVYKFYELLKECNNVQKEKLEELFNLFELKTDNILRSIDYKDALNVEEAINKLKSADCISEFWNSVIEMKLTLSKSSNEVLARLSDFEMLNVNINLNDSLTEYSITDYIEKIERAFSEDEKKWAEELSSQIDVLIIGDEFIGNDREDVQKYKNELTKMISCDISKKEFSNDLLNISNHLKKISRYVESYHTYISYALELGINVNPISDFYTADEIESQKCLLEKSMTTHISQEYIEKSINEVMKRHGYNINTNLSIKGFIPTIRCSNIDNIYENNDTHIRVFSSQSGHTVMEIVGDCSTELEAKKRYDEQVAFCQLYPEIIKELDMDYDIVINLKDDMHPQQMCKELNDNIHQKNKNKSGNKKKTEQELENK